LGRGHEERWYEESPRAPGWRFALDVSVLLFSLRKYADSFSHFTLRLYTRDLSVLSALVEDAHERYIKTTRPHVTVHTADILVGHLSSPLGLLDS
jgi:hypothetical protein